MCLLCATSVLEVDAQCNGYDSGFTVSVCHGNYVQVVANETSADVSYSWDFGSYGTSSEANAEFIYPENSTQYVTLEITYPGGSCSSTQFVDINDPTYTVIGSPGAVTQFSSLGLSNLNNGQFLVLGELVIDGVGTSADNSYFLMGAGAQITVNNGNAFVATGSTFEGCLIMWRGIFSKENGFVRVWHSDVSDAHIGVDINK